MYLIIGANGLIGKSLSRSFASQMIPHCMTSRHPGPGCIGLDLADDSEIWKLPVEPIDTAFFCAAQTSSKSCEEDPLQSAHINVENTVKLAHRLLDAGAFVIFPSTNLVFDGSKPFFIPDDAPNPTTEYGRQKARAERALLNLSRNVAVVRLTKVVHPGMALFRSWAESLQKGDVIHPFSDLLLSPISLDFTVSALERIASRKPSGITQLSGDRDISYEDCARVLAKWLNASEKLIQPVNAPSGRMGFSTLNMDRAAHELDLQVPSALETIDALCKSMS